MKPFDLGIAIEKRGINFYTKALKQVYDENSKNLLKFLIKEEKNHLDYFTKLKQSKTPAIKHEKFLFNKEAFKKIKSSSIVLFEIFETALAMEEMSIKLYTELGKKSNKNFFKKIANYEKKHKKLIKKHTDILYSYTIGLGGFEQPPIES